MRYTVILTDEVKAKLHALPLALRREIGHKLFLLEEDLSGNVDRFVALLFDETSDIDPPGPLGSRAWFEGWLHVLMEDADRITSALARITSILPPRSTSTPIARPFSITTRRAKARSRRTLPPFIAGRR